MPSPAERILDEAVRHRIALSRFSTATVRKALATLNRTDQQLVERILRADNEGRDPARLERMLEEVRALQADGWAVLRSRLVDDLEALADVERDFAARSVRFGQASAGTALSTNVPTTAQVVAAVNARPFQGRFLKDWLAEAETGAAKRVREALRQGFIEGRSVSDLVREIRGTRALQYRDGVLEISRRGAEAMVRTAITHTAAVSSRVTYEALGVAKATFIAVLDGRTTLTCAGLNGKTFPLDRFPYPPRHVNCRSTMVPEIAGLDPVPVRDYGEWLKAQPVEVQNDILGPARAKLFRAGGLSVDRFTDNKGRVLSLTELRHRDGGAFARAGLTPGASGPAKAAPAPLPRPARPLSAVNADHDRDMRAYTLTEGRRSGAEHLVIYDSATGKAFPPVTDGKKSSVSFPSWLVAEIQDAKNRIVLHHNHPSSSSFSHADLRIVSEFPGAKGIWAHGHNGSSFYAEAGTRALTTQTYARLKDQAQRWVQERVNRREMTVSDAGLIFHHVLNRLVERGGYVVYRADLQGESLAAFNRSKDLIDKFVAGFTV